MKWPLHSIGEVFNVARGGSPRPIQNFLTDSADGLNWIMIGDATVGSKYITKTKKRIKPEGLKKTRMVHEGDFLLTNSMSFGHPYILKTSGCIHDGWLVLSPRDKGVFPDFFYYLLGSDAIYREFSKRAAGAVVKNLNTDIVKSVQIPIPPLAEQKRIAWILDAADALRAKRRESLAQLEALVQSAFLTLFGDAVKNPLGWKVARLPEIISPEKHSLKRGPFGGALKKEIFVPAGFKVYEQKNVIYENFTSGSYFISDRDYKRMEAFSVSPNDLLVSCSGTIGKIAVVPPQAEAGVMNQALLKIRLNESKMTNTFFLNLWRSASFERQVLGMTHGTGMKNMKSMQELKGIEFVLPPIDLQRRFVTIVEAVEGQKARQRAYLAELDALFASLQHRAFNGELQAA